MDNELLNHLDALSVKLNVGVDKLYNVMLLQADIQLITSILLLVLSIGSLFFSIWLMKRVDDFTEPSVEGFVAICIGIISFIAVVANIAEIGTILTLLINPEYWALSKLLNIK